MLYPLGLEGLLTAPTATASAPAQALLAAREQARTARDFAKADRLRDELRVLGFEVRDGPEGPQLRAR
jgi:cysteinyl-tRNA synthetase